MMHALSHEVLDKLILHLKKNIKRPVAGVLGPNFQAELVIKNLGLSERNFSINSNEELYEINLEALNEFSMPKHMNVTLAQNVPKNILIEWMKSYDIEALGASNDKTLEKQVEEHWNLRLQKNDSWVLLLDGTPVALSAFNAALTVWCKLALFGLLQNIAIRALQDCFLPILCTRKSLKEQNKQYYLPIIQQQ